MQTVVTTEIQEPCGHCSGCGFVNYYGEESGTTPLRKTCDSCAGSKFKTVKRIVRAEKLVQE